MQRVRAAHVGSVVRKRVLRGRAAVLVLEGQHSEGAVGNVASGNFVADGNVVFIVANAIQNENQRIWTVVHGFGR